jgi:hypothetical protein
MFVALFTAFYVTTAVMCTLYFLLEKTDIASRPQNALKNFNKIQADKLTQRKYHEVRQKIQRKMEQD